MIDWLATLLQRLQGGDTVRVVVAATRGSVPREAGTCMLVSAGAIDGTIGGGHLELRAIEIARGMLQQPGSATRLDAFPLGATLGQCCGGAVTLWFERLGAQDLPFLHKAVHAREANPDALLVTRLEPGMKQRSIATSYLKEQGENLVERLAPDLTPLWLFGAGHVGTALVRVLEGLPFRVTWVDDREDVFPAQLPANVAARDADAAAAPPGTFFLVMTHSHDLDYEIVRAILARGDFAWAGLIGSETKARRFRQRLAAQGVRPERIARLISPIGIGGIESKLPAAIAVSVAAQLQQALEARAAGEASAQRAGSG